MHLPVVYSDPKTEMLFSDTICPRNLLRHDYALMEKQYDLALEPSMKMVLFPQSVVGHALMGHATIPRQFENTTIDDVVRAMGREPAIDKGIRQEYINRVMEWIFSDNE